MKHIYRDNFFFVQLWWKFFFFFLMFALFSVYLQWSIPNSVSRCKYPLSMFTLVICSHFCWKKTFPKSPLYSCSNLIWLLSRSVIIVLGSHHLKGIPFSCIGCTESWIPWSFFGLLPHLTDNWKGNLHLFFLIDFVDLFSRITFFTQSSLVFSWGGDRGVIN